MTTLFVLCKEVVLLGPQVLSFEDRFSRICPYLGESTIRGSPVASDVTCEGLI